jgi:hypothetical protein
LDLANVTGWAFGERTGRPLSGTWKLKGFSDQERPRSLASIAGNVRAFVKANGVDVVVMESALMGIQRKRKDGSWVQTSSHGDRSLVMLSGAAQGAAIEGGAKKVLLVAPQSWRKALFGDGRVANPKAHALRYCAMQGWTITDHNAAEAACILVWGHSQFLQEKLL